MLWIKEVELVDSVDDLKSSCSVKGIHMPNFEVLDAKIASALNKIIHNTHGCYKRTCWESVENRRIEGTLGKGSPQSNEANQEEEGNWRRDDDDDWQRWNRSWWMSVERGGNLNARQRRRVIQNLQNMVQKEESGSIDLLKSWSAGFEVKFNGSRNVLEDP